MADAMKLLPCPFCGENPSDVIQNGYIENREEGGYFKFVWCENCDAKSAERKTEAEAAEAWNRRASPPAREEAPAEQDRIDWQAQDAVAGALHSILPLDVDWQHMRIAGRAFVDTLSSLRNRAPAEGAGELVADLEALLAAEPVFVVNHPIQRAINAIRNRTSEPEAGEARAWVLMFEGVEPSVHLDESPITRHFKAMAEMDPRYTLEPLFPATADKLRLEATMIASCVLDAAFDGESDTARSIPAGEVAHLVVRARALRQALSTLNEGGE